ncbi:accessory gene regulator ArgB-like protein [Lacrimispora brassicae]
MIEKMTKISTDYLIRNRVIDEEDRDIYEYGFHSLYNNIIDIASILIISVWLQQVVQTILYHISFVALRNTAGGFHAQTHFRCFIMSTSIWLLSLWGISHIASTEVCIALAGLSVFFVWLKAPIEHKNNPLSTKKQKRMKIFSRIIVIIFFVIILSTSVLLPDKYNWITASLAYGMVTHMLLILVTFITKG